MTEEILPGGMIMVRIDGSKVKRLREQQGLTQLYVATAVQVTTDTISRWENKRYPSVKKENCIRLAETLGVSFEDILEQHELSDNEEVPIPADTAGQKPIVATKKLKPWHLLFLGLGLLVSAAGAGWYFFLQTNGSSITAQRVLPRHCLPGQPFPVIIEVKDTPEKAITLILREMLPSGAVLKKASPALSTPPQKSQELKWLEKIDGPTRFVYTVTLKGKPGDTFKFSGNIAVSRDSENLRAVLGNDTIQIGTFHWADTDEDNTLSDKEMLAVHDHFNTADKLDIDLDLIEKIWLGSGYRWNAKNSTCEILP
ncbi:MAG: helix-turn-helix transcriptional regulator [Desulfoprunum sp.]|nr:helix-turn-helix transcriptional regulator [Desulfoprunum sp.]